MAGTRGSLLLDGPPRDRRVIPVWPLCDRLFAHLRVMASPAVKIAKPSSLKSWFCRFCTLAQ